MFLVARTTSSHIIFPCLAADAPATACHACIRLVAHPLCMQGPKQWQPSCVSIHLVCTPSVPVQSLKRHKYKDLLGWPCDYPCCATLKWCRAPSQHTHTHTCTDLCMHVAPRVLLAPLPACAFLRIPWHGSPSESASAASSTPKLAFNKLWPGCTNTHEAPYPHTCQDRARDTRKWTHNSTHAPKHSSRTWLMWP